MRSDEITLPGWFARVALRLLGGGATHQNERAIPRVAVVQEIALAEFLQSLLQLLRFRAHRRQRDECGPWPDRGLPVAGPPPAGRFSFPWSLPAGDAALTPVSSERTSTMASVLRLRRSVTFLNSTHVHGRTWKRNSATWAKATPLKEAVVWRALPAESHCDWEGVTIRPSLVAATILAGWSVMSSATVTIRPPSTLSMAGENDTPPTAVPCEPDPRPLVWAAVSHAPAATPHRTVQLFRSWGSTVAGPAHIL